jgi:hypothetical protein
MPSIWGVGNIFFQPVGNRNTLLSLSRPFLDRNGDIPDLAAMGHSINFGRTVPLPCRLMGCRDTVLPSAWVICHRYSAGRKSHGQE